MKTGENLDPAVFTDFDEHPAGVFEPVTDPGVLDAAGDARFRRRLVCLAHRLEGLSDAAALVHQLAGGEAIARVENIALADVVAVEPDLFGESVEDALHGEGGLVGAESAHGAARWVVGVDRLRLDGHIRHRGRARTSDRRRARGPLRPPRRKRRCPRIIRASTAVKRPSASQPVR